MTADPETFEFLLDQARRVDWEAPQARGSRLWLVDLDHVSASDANLMGWLTSHERHRSMRFRFEKDARRYRAAHAVLNAVLSRLTGGDPNRLQITEGSHGKPALPDHPWHFNLSHSEGWALIGAGTDGPMGVDLEVPRWLNDADELAQRNFNHREYLAYLHAPEEDRLRRFYRCWTRKEACLKAVGSGLSIEPHTFDAGDTCCAAQTSILFESRPFDLNVWTVTLPIDAIAAVAFAADVGPTEGTLAPAPSTGSLT